MRTVLLFGMLVLPVLCEAGVLYFPWMKSWTYSNNRKKGKDSNRSVSKRDAIFSSDVPTLSGTEIRSVLDQRHAMVFYHGPRCSDGCSAVLSEYEAAAKRNVRRDITFGRVECGDDRKRAVCSSKRMADLPVVYLYRRGSTERPSSHGARQVVARTAVEFLNTVKDLQ
ncbi:uncharacterized protein [Ptychodera flava]|uniref:uncharacterized protein n=1 Tax=Ptychodera flava TaxID=63121 RepID=UPI003969FC3E